MKREQEVVQGFKYLLDKISMRGSNTSNAAIALELIKQLNNHLTSTGGNVPIELNNKIVYELERMGYVGGIEIIFTKNIGESFETDAIIFEATINGKRLVCRVSQEALEDNFDKNQDTSYLDVFYKNVNVIENKATQKIRRGEYTFEDGLILVSTDF